MGMIDMAGTGRGKRGMSDRVAIIGIGTTGCSRHDVHATPTAHALRAGAAAIGDAGLRPADIDGIFGSTPAASHIARGLGLGNTMVHLNAAPPIVTPLMAAAAAVYAGSCNAALVYHTYYRMPGQSRAAAADPFRRGLRDVLRESWAAPSESDGTPESLAMATGYAAWASRYAAEFGLAREELGLLAVNAHTNAKANPLAASRGPITLDDYLGSRMIRDPLCLYDMDLPVDGADAFVVTTARLAARAPHPPVLIHAAVTALTDHPDEQSLESLERSGITAAADELWRRSALGPDDCDVIFLYDGFSIIEYLWLEAFGYCTRGGAGDWLLKNWDAELDSVRYRGQVPVNPHGGALGEGATQGSGHLREAVTQLRGEAGDRQVSNAGAAVLGIGGPFFNAQAVLLKNAGLTVMGAMEVASGEMPDPDVSAVNCHCGESIVGTSTVARASAAGCQTTWGTGFHPSAGRCKCPGWGGRAPVVARASSRRAQPSDDPVTPWLAPPHPA
jgi:acetyl-CoA acetyltransferase